MFSLGHFLAQFLAWRCSKWQFLIGRLDSVGLLAQLGVGFPCQDSNGMMLILSELWDLWWNLQLVCCLISIGSKGGSANRGRGGRNAAVSPCQSRGAVPSRLATICHSWTSEAINFFVCSNKCSLGNGRSEKTRDWLGWTESATVRNPRKFGVFWKGQRSKWTTRAPRR